MDVTPTVPTPEVENVVVFATDTNWFSNVWSVYKLNLNPSNVESDKSNTTLLPLVGNNLGLIAENSCSAPPVDPIETILGGDAIESSYVSANLNLFLSIL